MAIKPTKVTDWATAAGALTTATDSSRKTLGWQTVPDNLPSQPGEKPNLNQQNYWQLAVHEWNTYFDTWIDERIQMPPRRVEFYTHDFAIGDVDIVLDTITVTAHSMQDGDTISFSGDYPLGIGGSFNYVIVLDANTIQVASSIANAIAGTAIDLIDVGSGVMTVFFRAIHIRTDQMPSVYLVYTNGKDIDFYLELPTDLADGHQVKILKADSSPGQITVQPSFTGDIEISGLDFIITGLNSGVTLVADQQTVGFENYQMWRVSNRIITDSGVRDLQSQSMAWQSADVDIVNNMVKTASSAFRGSLDVVRLTGSDLPLGVDTVTDYYLVPRDALHYSFSTSLANALSGVYVDLTDQGTGLNGTDSTFGLPQQYHVYENDGYSTYRFITIDTLGADLKLPDTDSQVGRKVKIFKESANLLTVSVVGSGTINGQSTITLFTADASATLVCVDAGVWVAEVTEQAIDLLFSDVPSAAKILPLIDPSLKKHKNQFGVAKQIENMTLAGVNTDNNGGGVVDPRRNVFYFPPHTTRFQKVFDFDTCRQYDIGAAPTFGDKPGIYNPLGDSGQGEIIWGTSATGTTFAYNRLRNEQYIEAATGVTMGFSPFPAGYSPLNDRVYYMTKDAVGAAPTVYYMTGSTRVWTGVTSTGLASPGWTYQGGCYNPVDDKIYLAPKSKGTGGATWHRIVCSTGILEEWTAHAITDGFSGYVGATFDPINERIFFGPAANDDVWQYLDCNTQTMVTYDKSAFTGPDSFYSTGAPCFSPATGKMYFTARAGSPGNQLPYIDCNDATPVIKVVDGSSGDLDFYGVLTYIPSQGLMVDSHVTSGGLWKTISEPVNEAEVTVAGNPIYNSY